MVEPINPPVCRPCPERCANGASGFNNLPGAIQVRPRFNITPARATWGAPCWVHGPADQFQPQIYGCHLTAALILGSPKTMYPRTGITIGISGRIAAVSEDRRQAAVQVLHVPVCMHDSTFSSVAQQHTRGRKHHAIQRCSVQTACLPANGTALARFPYSIATITQPLRHPRGPMRDTLQLPR